MSVHPHAGKPAPAASLINVIKLECAYYQQRPDLSDSTQLVNFGTSGHRGTAFDGTFTEAHVIAITQAICDYRSSHQITGPLYLGKDTHALSGVAQQTVLEVLTGNNVETCNNLDDDCDGVIDEGNPGGGAACDGTDGDLCPEGTIVCTSGALVCNDATGTTVETCNGLDDNCNGQIDEGNPGGGATCDGSDSDACKEGTFTCTGGVLVCSDTSGNNVESCNGVDDDCDGLTDEGNPGGGVACDGPDSDFCPEGVTACTAGAIVCSDNTGSNAELCNGLDDNCNGTIDESPTNVGVACTVGSGTCARNGATVCVGGAPVCNVSPGAPGTELCNGLDDDCDGVVDDGFSLGASCDGTGACGIGVIECATLTSTQCCPDRASHRPGWASV